MQKRVKEYLNKLTKQKKSSEKAVIAALLLAVMVIGSVAGILGQYGVAFTDDGQSDDFLCGLEEHQHDENCYEVVLICGYGENTGGTAEEKEPSDSGGNGVVSGDMEKILVCGLKEGGDHQHTDDCRTAISVLTCDQGEGGGHRHTDDCYSDDELICGKDESDGHQHTDDCYSEEEILTCDQEEGGHQHTDSCYAEVSVRTEAEEQAENAGNAEDVEDMEDDPISEEHIHTEACYEYNLICELEEHIHTEDCMIDTSVDVESMYDWERMFADVEWEDAWGADLVTAAKMQIGYRESELNYRTAEDKSHKGYTRYGAFSGVPYADWDAAFVNFCMYYAGLFDSGLFPGEINADEWLEEFKEADEKNIGYLASPGDYIPESGDLIFFESGKEMRMGIVSAFTEEENEVIVLEGNSDDEVKENTYAADDGKITEYLKITELETAYKESALRYEDDQVVIVVSAVDEDAIPKGVTLNVIPIVKDNEETEEQYNDVEERLQNKVQADDEEDETEYLMGGFLAYDISLINKDGVEVEPNGKVNVSMRYKVAVRPDEVSEDADNLAVTVMHLEKDESGSVREVVDMMESEQLKEMTVTEEQKVQNVEFETDSFSVFSLTWTDSLVSTYAATAASTTTMPAPVHHKYIKRNAASDGSTNTYTISLDVRGKTSIKTVDLVLIVDASSSMTHDNNKNANRVQNAVTQLVKDAKKSRPDNVKIRLAIVEFSTGFDEKGNYDYGSPYGGWVYKNGDGKVVTTRAGNGSSAGEFPTTAYGVKSTVPDKAYKKSDSKADAKTTLTLGKGNIAEDLASNYKYTIGGYGCATNWQAGIMQAEKLLNNRTDTGKKNDTYVVFLTDGLPTARYTDGSATQTQGACQEAYYLNNTVGYTGTANPNFKAAKTEWNKSTNIKNAKGKYVVYVGDTNCKNGCDDFAKAVGATLKSGNSATNLANTFTSILNKITTKAYTDVVIQDTLSGYVDYAYKKVEASNFSVYRINSEGKSTKLPTTQYKLTITGKTFKVELLDNEGELRNNYIYRVQINVIPSQAAIKYHLQNNTSSYPSDVKGDAGTDGPDLPTGYTKTSSNKAGFWSNNNANAKVAYKAEGVSGSALYEKPVIQVETTSWMAVKKWAGDPEDSIVVSLKASVSGLADTELTYINNILKGKNITLNAGNSWKGTWSNLPKYHYYYNANGNATHKAITYTVTEEKVIRKNADGTEKDVTAEYLPASAVSGTTTTITNTRKGMLYVEKSWDDGADQHEGDPVAIGLYQNGKPAGDLYKNQVIILDSSNDWKGSFSLGAKAVTAQYSIKELAESSKDSYDFTLNGKYYTGIDNGAAIKVGDANYVVAYSKPVETSLKDGNTIKVTNAPASDWQIVKRSTSEGNPVLSGAKFTLTDGSTAYTGESGDNGLVKWENVTSQNPIKDGTYTLTETQAPEGYEIGAEWTITIKDGKPDVEGQTGEEKDNVVTFYYDDTPSYYELPSTGGIGTYWYMISGTLLMLAGVLVLYKKKIWNM